MGKMYIAFVKGKKIVDDRLFIDKSARDVKLPGTEDCF